jgi:hypothetical protein
MYLEAGMNMPTKAGILNIIGGALQSVIGIICVAFIITAIATPGSEAYIAFHFIPCTPLVLTGVVAIIGGIYTLKRKKWFFSLTASIFSFIPFSVALIFITEWTYVHFEDFPFLWSTSLGDNIYVLTIFILPVILGIISISLTLFSRNQFERA